jgi:hypothetical protein
MGVYERVLSCCPYCGHVPVPAGRSSPEQVDGDLCELTPEALARLRGEVARVDGDPRYPVGAAPEVVGAIHRRHLERQAAQVSLRASIALWAGWQRSLGRNDPEAYKRFWFTYGTDVMTAQSLSTKDADELTTRIILELSKNNIVEGPPC